MSVSVVKCVVTGCPSRHMDGTGTGESFHRPVKRFFSFPADPVRVKVWLAALRESDQRDPTERLLICEDHFLPEDVSGGEVGADAIPIMPPYLDGPLGTWGGGASEEEEEEEEEEEVQEEETQIQQVTDSTVRYSEETDLHQTYIQALQDGQVISQGVQGLFLGGPSLPRPPQGPTEMLQNPVGGSEDPPAEETSRPWSQTTQTGHFKKVPKRGAVSLRLLTLRFVRLILAAPDRSIDIRHAAVMLQTRRRRLEAVTDALKELDLVHMEADVIRWTGRCPASIFLSEEDQIELENLQLVEKTLDGLIERCSQQLFTMTNDMENTAFAYVSHEDMRRLRVFQEQTVIVIKAPEETTLKVSAPEQLDIIQMHLKTKKCPIMVGTSELGSDGAVTFDPRQKSGVFSPLERSRVSCVLCPQVETADPDGPDDPDQSETRSQEPAAQTLLEPQTNDTRVWEQKGPAPSWTGTEAGKPGKPGPRCQSSGCVHSDQLQCGWIGDAERDSLFQHFWHDLDWTQRKEYVASLVDMVKSWSVILGFRKSYVRYHLHVRGQRRRVCRSMFLSTLGVSQKYVVRCAGGTAPGGRDRGRKSQNCPATAEAAALKAALCSYLSSSVSSTESLWFGV